MSIRDNVLDATVAAKRRAYHRAQRDTIDADAKTPQEKSARIDLGLALLSMASLPGKQFTRYDIAVWCGCTNALIYLVEIKALKKLANALQFGRARALGREIALQPRGRAIRRSVA